MKSKVTVLFLVLILVLMGIAASVCAQGGSAEKGKALVEAKKCDVCHKEGSDKGKPMEKLVGTYDDAFLKDAITNPKKVLKPDVKMPPYKLTDEQVNDVIAYLKSIKK